MLDSLLNCLSTRILITELSNHWGRQARGVWRWNFRRGKADIHTAHRQVCPMP